MKVVLPDSLLQRNAGTLQRINAALGVVTFDMRSSQKGAVLCNMMLGAFGCFVLIFTLRVNFRPHKFVGEVDGPARPLSWVWLMTSLGIPYGFVLSSLGLMISPLEAERLWPEDHSAALGLLMSASGIAQLFGPLAGYLSDICRCHLGRRRPVLIWMACVLWTLSFCLWYLSLCELRYTYLLTLGCFHMALNIMLTTQAGLVPDLVPKCQQEVAGGCAAANMLIGAVASTVYAHFTESWDYHAVYGIYAVQLAVFTVLVCASGREINTAVIASDGEDAEISWQQTILQNYTFDVQKYRAFALLLVTKTMYASQVVIKAFLLFFLQDTFRSLPKSSYEDMVGQIIVAAEAPAAMAAVTVMFWASEKHLTRDNATRNARSSLVNAQMGLCWMGCLWLGGLWIGYLANDQSEQAPAAELKRIWMPHLLGVFAIWGLGQGVYVAGDQALGFALLPDRSEASRYLGFTSITLCLGSILGSVASASLLAFFGSGAKEGCSYAFSGYVALFVFAAILSVCTAAVARYIDASSAAALEE